LFLKFYNPELDLTFEKARGYLEKHDRIRLFLDRDDAGMRCTRRVMQISEKYKDESEGYKGYKDINDWLVKKWES